MNQYNEKNHAKPSSNTKNSKSILLDKGHSINRMVVEIKSLSSIIFGLAICLMLSGCNPESKQTLQSNSINSNITQSQLVVFLPGGGFIRQPENCEQPPNVQGLPSLLTDAGWEFKQLCYPVAPPYTYPLSKDVITSQVSELIAEYDKVVLIGSSAGANIALLAAIELQDSLAGVVGYYGLYDIPSLPEDVKTNYTNIYTDDPFAASPSTYPLPDTQILLLHGMNDQLIPFDQSTNYCNSCTTLIPEKAHSFLLTETWDELSAFLNSL
ncbi:alpha/beta hydrolase [Enterovibrio calviensis]|uniref:alpha/beta hydrolase n=1 Tax=Enterovibrio calviensis TaxID=91359 RepID=UPI0004817D4F|nr:alpha/beta hydrolase [Enterovibrio calviensis]